MGTRQDFNKGCSWIPNNIHTSLLSMSLKIGAVFQQLLHHEYSVCCCRPKKPPAYTGPGRSVFLASSGMTLTICRENLQIQQYQENSPNHVYQFMALHPGQPPVSLSAVVEMMLSRRDWHHHCRGLGLAFDFERALLLSFSRANGLR